MKVSLTEEGATNGRILVNYDADKLELVSCNAADDSWFTSFNTQEAGQVYFAWAASDLGAEETQMFNLVFRAKDSLGLTEKTVVTGEVTELYDSGAVLTTDPDQVSLQLQRDLIGEIIGGGIAGGGSGSGSHPFVDLDGHWAEDEVAKAYENGLVNGTDATHFSPDAPVTRGMFVTFLHRLSDEERSSAELPFVDVPAGKYYTEPVRWAYENEVVNGTNATHFSPDALVTRQEMVAMLYRYAKYTGMDVSGRDTLSAFTDVADVASWALTPMKWSVAESVINGAHGKLNPLANATRAEAAAILVRFAGM